MIFGLNSIKKTIEEDIIDKPIMSIVKEDNSSKLYFNLKAMDYLTLTLGEKNQVAISFSNAHKGEVFIVNGNEFDSVSTLNVTKGRFITSKRYANEILKSLKLNKDQKITKLEIVKTDREFQNNTIFKLKLYNEDEKAIEELNENEIQTIVEDEILDLSEEIKDINKEKELI